MPPVRNVETLDGGLGVSGSTLTGEVTSKQKFFLLGRHLEVKGDGEHEEFG